MTFIRQNLSKHFIIALKSNRTVAVSEQSKKQGHFNRIDSLEWSEQKTVRGWLKGLDSLLLHRQVFTNKDGSTGILYLACSDFDCDVTREANASPVVVR